MKNHYDRDERLSHFQVKAIKSLSLMCKIQISILEEIISCLGEIL